MSGPEIHNARILLVDDDPGAIQVLHRALSEFHEIRFATRGKVALDLVREAPPDLILLDAEMPEMSGIEMFWQLRADAAFANTPVIFVTSHHETHLQLEAFDLGAADFISKPINPALLKARVTTQLRLKLLTDQLRTAAACDGLTGLANRRRFDEHLDMECRRALGLGAPISLLLVDVDHFKAYNDHAGHLAGDDALRAVADTLSAHARRAGEMVARYGGEEFAIILPGLSADAARSRADEARQAVVAQAIPHPASEVASVVTVSIGVSTLCTPPGTPPPAGENAPRELIGHADRALYKAKQTGRNRICVENYLYPISRQRRGEL